MCQKRFEHAFGEVVHLDRRPRFRREHQLVRDVRLAVEECLDEPFIAEFQENASELMAHVNPSRLLAFGCEHLAGPAPVVGTLHPYASVRIVLDLTEPTMAESRHDVEA